MTESVEKLTRESTVQQWIDFTMKFKEINESDEDEINPYLDGLKGLFVGASLEEISALMLDLFAELIERKEWTASKTLLVHIGKCIREMEQHDKLNKLLEKRGLTINDLAEVFQRQRPPEAENGGVIVFDIRSR